MEDPQPEAVAEKVEDGGIPPRSLNLAELVPEKKVGRFPKRNRRIQRKNQLRYELSGRFLDISVSGRSVSLSFQGCVGRYGDGTSKPHNHSVLRGLVRLHFDPRH